MQVKKKKKAAMLALLIMAAAVLAVPISYAESTREGSGGAVTAVQVDEEGNVDKGADVDPVSRKTSDDVIYHAMYIMEHGDSRYIDVSSIDLEALARPVTVARGVATYNYDRQNEWEFGSNSVFSMDYEIPVYDIDDDSAYYVAVPDVNLGTEETGSYDFTLAYNNNCGEVIDGYVYKDSIAYIPKSAVDDPENRESFISDTPVAMQLNYYFRNTDDSGMMFSKTFPVQILRKGIPEYRTVRVENMFADNSVSFPIGDLDKSDIAVMLNGTVLPIAESAYDVAGGILTVHTSAAVISGVNVFVKGKPFIERVRDMLTEDVHAAGVAPKDMKHYKTSKGSDVILTSDLGEIYTGWRGHYQAPEKIYCTPKDQTGYLNFPRFNTLRDLPEWVNSIDYMYGAYATGYGNYSGYWALASYTKGVDISDGKTVVKDAEHELYDSSTGTKKTMYEWLRHWTQHLEKNNGKYGPDSDKQLYNNGLSGVTNFAVPFPKSRITGDDRNLISNRDNPGYASTSSGNPDLIFDAETESGKPAIEAGDYFAATCAHLDSDGSEDGTFDGENSRTVYVSCLAKGKDYIVLCFAIAGVTKQEAMGVYKFKTQSYGRFSIKKIPDPAYEEAVKAGKNVYSLEGARYTLYEDQDCKTAAESEDGGKVVLTTDKSGKAESPDIASGTYYLKETKASPGYAVREGTLKVSIKAGETTELMDKKILKEIPVTLGSLEINKVDKDTGRPEPQGNARLAGTRFTVAYYDNMDGVTSGEPRLNWVIQTIDESGSAALDDEHLVSGSIPKSESGKTILPLGTYELSETEAPVGYRLSAEKKIAVAAVSGEKAKLTYTSGEGDTFRNEVKRFGIKLQKTDNDFSEAYAQGDATLESAEFTIWNVSDHSIVSGGREIQCSAEHKDENTVMKIHTDGKGYAATGNSDLPYGKYFIKETVPSDGYLLNDRWEFIVWVYSRDGQDKVDIIGMNNDDGAVNETLDFTDGMMVDLTGYQTREAVKRGGVQIVKRDKELQKSEALGGADLSDIVFTIRNVSSHDIAVRNDPVVIKTDSFQMTVSSLCDSSQLYGAGDPGLVQPKGNAVAVDWKKLSSKEISSGSTVKRVQPGQDAGVVITHWNKEKKAYTAETLPDDLPYGTYTIRESMTNDSYQRTDTSEHRFEIREDGTVRWYGEAERPDAFIFDDYVYRGSLGGVKIGDGKSDRFGYVPFTVTMKATGERHVIVTDENGRFASGDMRTDDELNENEFDKKDTGVNPFDDLIGMAPESITEDMMYKRRSQVRQPVWFGTGRAGSQAAYDSGVGALPYGEYNIEELRCERNRGYKLQKFDFSVEDKSRHAAVDLGTVTDDEKVPEIRTVAESDGRKELFGAENAVITDTVTVKNLKHGSEYRLEGVLMDRQANAFVFDKDGDEVKAETSFHGDVDKVEMVFTFDASMYRGHDIVVFETLYEKTDEGEKEAASHRDLTDRSQTVSIPKAETSASWDKDQNVKECVVTDDDIVEMTDTVRYSNLTPGDEYEVTGYLYDADTFTAVIEQDGRQVSDQGNKITDTADGMNIDIDRLPDLKDAVKSSVRFVPEKRDGEVKVIFRISRDSAAGKRIVTFEDVRNVTGGADLRAALHADWNDRSQMTYMPALSTTAHIDGRKKVTADGSDITVTDIVRYTGLSPGEEHTIRGILYDKKTGKPAEGKDRKVIEAERTFTPSEPSGEVDVSFKVGGGMLSGTTAVAFEELYGKKGDHIASHADINNKAQTVTIAPDSPDEPEKQEDDEPEDEWNGGIPPYRSPKMGDLQAGIIPVYVLLAVSAAAAAIWLRRRRNGQKGTKGGETAE